MVHHFRWVYRWALPQAIGVSSVLPDTSMRVVKLLICKAKSLGIWLLVSSLMLLKGKWPYDVIVTHISSCARRSGAARRWARCGR